MVRTPLDRALVYSAVHCSLLKELGAWGEKSMYGKTSMGIIRTTYLVNEEGIIEAIFSGKQIKTKIHAEQLLDYMNRK